VVEECIEYVMSFYFVIRNPKGFGREKRGASYH